MGLNVPLLSLISLKLSFYLVFVFFWKDLYILKFYYFWKGKSLFLLRNKERVKELNRRKRKGGLQVSKCSGFFILNNKKIN